MLNGYLNPKSVVQRAPASGVFSYNNLNECQFVTKVMSHWLIVSGRAGAGYVETPQHIEEAYRLFSLYKDYRLSLTEEADRGNRGRVLYSLYATGCIEEARAILNKKAA